MSTPINQLSKYRSYSYYHVLCMCDSSYTATMLASETSNDVWQHPKSNDSKSDTVNLGKYSVKTLSDGTSRYCVFINGSTDTAFIINKASWTSYTAASATMNDRNTSIALEGQLTISEPKGVALLDQIVRCCLQLGVDSANVFWVLKTFFVGYTTDAENGDGVEYISNIPPVIFITYDVQGNFGVSGGEYELSFVAAANGAARLPQFSKSVTSINLKAQDSFVGTLLSLQENINDNYNKYFDCVYKQVEAIPGNEELKNSLRKVKYVITCGEPYLNPDGTPNTSYTVSDQSIQVKDYPECGSPSNIHISSGVSIEDAIHRIVGMCPKIKEEASVGVNGIKYTHKIHTWVESKPSSPGSNVLEFMVGYRVERQLQPRSVSFDAFNKNSELTTELAKNVIEFDYLYTGKNIDILDFDIKMNMGMVYLQGMTITNPYKHPSQSVPIKASTIAEQDFSRLHGKNIPVFFGSQIKTSSIKDTQNALHTAQHAYSMSKHASLEMLEATIKITGNSQLLGAINNTSSSEKVRDKQTKLNADTQYTTFANWSLSPSFAKINIKMPRNNDDQSLFTGQQTSSDDGQSNDYAVDFWFTGYYYVYGIEHVFDNGEFFQTLEALGIPEKNSFKTEQNTKIDEDINLNKTIGACYEHRIGCNDVLNSGGTILAPEYNESLNSNGIKQELSEHTPATNKNLSNIKGYDQASPAVKRAIHNAAINNGVDEFTLAQMCAIESGFKPNAQNPTSSAGGLFQFVDDTWNGYGGGNKFDPELNADRGAKYMKSNQQALGNALGREPTASEIYLAHNQGVGSTRRKNGAIGTLRQIQDGNGNQIATSRSDSTDKSANGVALWAKNKMGSVLKNSMPYDTYDKVLPTKRGLQDDNVQPRTAKHALASSLGCSVVPTEQEVKNSCINVPKTEQNKEQTPNTSSNTPTLGQIKKVDPYDPIVSNLRDML
ncbi:MAG: transglycosylase SLT domain-containing protein [Nitrososphaeraceae archaeon]